MSNFELAVDIASDLLSRDLIKQDNLSEVANIIEDSLNKNFNDEDNYPILI